MPRRFRLQPDRRPRLPTGRFAGFGGGVRLAAASAIGRELNSDIDHVGIDVSDSRRNEIARRQVVQARLPAYVDTHALIPSFQSGDVLVANANSNHIGAGGLAKVAADDRIS